MNAGNAGQLAVILLVVFWGWWQLIKMAIRAEQKHEAKMELQHLLAGIGHYLIKRDAQKAQPTREFEQRAFNLEPFPDDPENDDILTWQLKKSIEMTKPDNAA